jgi:hypothetical protein
LTKAAKLNLNTVNPRTSFQFLPNMTVDFANAIMDWRGTNGVVSLDYIVTRLCAEKCAVRDGGRAAAGLRRDRGDLLAGEDMNRNGVLDANEKDSTGTGELDSGLLRRRRRSGRASRIFIPTARR